MAHHRMQTADVAIERVVVRLGEQLGETGPGQLRGLTSLASTCRFPQRRGVVRALELGRTLP